MQVGDVVAGRFHLTAVAGAGGMGVVFRARDRSGGGEVALKVMRPIGEGALTRFGREAIVLKALSHPGIVRFVADGETSEGERWLAMEWLEGEDLGTRLSRGALSIEASLSVARGIAEALAHLHAQGVVHRDLKPSNVWLVGGRETAASVKLLDFGTVRKLDAREQLRQTREGTTIGTPGYLSPEQARGALDIDSTADVFALGCVLFECIAGRPAFEGSHPIARIAKVLLETAPRLSSIAPVSEALDELVEQMLTPDRVRRPFDAAEVVVRLRALRNASEPLATGRVSLRPLFREQRWLCLLLVRVPDASMEDATVIAGPSEEHAILRAAEAHGARLEPLVGGSQVLLWAGIDGPVELATRAARAALEIHDALRWPSALAAGRARIDGSIPVGEALDRVAACVARSTGGVVLDESIARLLDEGFEIAREDRSVTLVRERVAGEPSAAIPLREWPCVGRGIEVSLLSVALTDALRAREAKVVVMTGEAGVGKSRVLREWLRSLITSQPQARVWRAHADPLSSAAAHGVAARLVMDACEVPFGANREVIRQRINDGVARVVAPSERLRVASRLCELCGAPWLRDLDDALALARQDPIVMGDQLRAAWEDFLVASSNERPVVLAIDNLHWADAPSLRLIDRVLRNFGERPWMVVGVGRPEPRATDPDLWRARSPQRVTLGPLSEQAAERWVRAGLGADAPDQTVRWILERCAGNAGALELLLRAKLEGHGDETPETVLAMIESRMMKLDPALRRVLRAASVFGGRFDAAGVEAALGSSIPQGAIESLLQQGWLLRHASGGLSFAQSTAGEAAYAMLPAEDRRLGHARAARVLFGGCADPAVIAEHFTRAEEPALAAPCWARAAVSALEANDFLGCIDRALSAERSGASGDALYTACCARVEALSWLDDTSALRAAASRLERVADGVSAHEINALRWASLGALREGDLAAVERAVDRALAVVARDASDDAVAFFAVRIATLALAAGLSARADALVAALDSIEPPLRARGPRVQAALSRWRAARAHHAHDAEASVKLRRDAAFVLRLLGDARAAASEESTRGYQLILLGAHEEGRKALERSLSECARLGLSFAVAATRHNLGLALLGLGRLEEALAHERAAVEAFAHNGNRTMECYAREYAARIQLAAGHVEEALAEAHRARALVPIEHVGARMAGCTVADALMTRRGPGDAARALDEVTPAREALRDNPESFEEPARVLRVHLEALAGCGRREELRAAAHTAHAWVLARAERIASDSYRRAFLERALDVAAILRISETSG